MWYLPTPKASSPSTQDVSCQLERDGIYSTLYYRHINAFKTEIICSACTAVTDSTRKTWNSSSSHSPSQATLDKIKDKDIAVGGGCETFSLFTFSKLDILLGSKESETETVHFFFLNQVILWRFQQLWDGLAEGGVWVYFKVCASWNNTYKDRKLLRRGRLWRSGRASSSQSARPRSCQFKQVGGWIKSRKLAFVVGIIPDVCWVRCFRLTLIQSQMF